MKGKLRGKNVNLTLLNFRKEMEQFNFVPLCPRELDWHWFNNYEVAILQHWSSASVL